MCAILLHLCLGTYRPNSLPSLGPSRQNGKVSQIGFPETLDSLGDGGPGERDGGRSGPKSPFWPSLLSSLLEVPSLGSALMVALARSLDLGHS